MPIHIKNNKPQWITHFSVVVRLFVACVKNTVYVSAEFTTSRLAVLCSAVLVKIIYTHYCEIYTGVKYCSYFIKYVYTAIVISY